VGERVLVYGGSGHGMTLIDALRVLPAFEVAGVVDTALETGQHVLGVAVLGGDEALPGAIAAGITHAVNGVGAIRDLSVRAGVFERLLAAGFGCPSVVHPAAWVDPSAAVSDGAQVLAQAYVGATASVGFGVVVNTGAIVSHGCVVGACANLSPGALLAGDVSVGDRALVGMGATVNLGLRIGADAVVGNSAVVKADVPAGTRVKAGQVWG
jgi:sugar O-acyltransferase (sialic acid O-acetyltransferase NeuD family)